MKQTIQETVKIVNPKSESGFSLINKCDFNPEVNELFYCKKSLDKDLVLFNLNTATELELLDLPTIGTVKAKRIIESRPFTSVNQAKEYLSTFVNWDLAFKDLGVTI